jgi:uncharacterized membrane protein YgcG
VVQVTQGENLIVSTSPDLTTNTVTVTNMQGIPIDLVPLPSNAWSLQDLLPGVYTLNVNVAMSSSGILGTYETILVVLAPDQQPLPPTTIINQITIRPGGCPPNHTYVNGTCVRPTPLPPPPPPPPPPCDPNDPDPGEECICPEGTTGTPPNCIPEECPEGTTGTPPNCIPEECPEGTTGTPPNCQPIEEDGEIDGGGLFNGEGGGDGSGGDGSGGDGSGGDGGDGGGAGEIDIPSQFG